jgi:hypothetical protein
MSLLDLPANELKRQITTAKELAAVMKFFFDEFVDAPGFMESSRPIEVPPALAQCVGRVAASLWPNENIAAEWQVGEVPMLRIVHGTALLKGTPAVVLWASDISAGILSLPDIATGKTIYARISMFEPHKRRPN